MKKIHEIIKEHPFFKGFTDNELLFISGCGQNKVFKANEIIAQENTPANEFYLLREGKVAVCANIPHHQDKIIQTISEGEILGWSWLFPPYQWTFELRALETTHAVALNGKCLRDKLDEMPELGYKLMKRFSQLMVARLNATRLQLLDIYQKKGS
ncbi:MAG: cyclic nucleotide-binding domain-containing protein [Candidatus Berkiellales bacterium]